MHAQCMVIVHSMVAVQVAGLAGYLNGKARGCSPLALTTVTKQVQESLTTATKQVQESLRLSFVLLITIFSFCFMLSETSLWRLTVRMTFGVVFENIELSSFFLFLLNCALWGLVIIWVLFL